MNEAEELTERKILRLFPNASRSFVAANAGAEVVCLRCKRVFTAAAWRKRKYCSAECAHSPGERLAVKGPRKGWRPFEDKILREMYALGDPSHDIAMRLGRSVAGIHCRAMELNLKHVAIGRWKRPPKKTKPAPLSPEERRQRRSELMRERHATRGHHMKGKHHSAAAKQKISAHHRGKKVPRERVDAGLRTKFERYGTIAPQVRRGSWRAGWREVGGKRFYARSTWIRSRTWRIRRRSASVPERMLFTLLTPTLARQRLT